MESDNKKTSCTANIKKPQGLERLVEGLKLSPLDNSKRAIVEGDSLIFTALRMYELLMEEKIDHNEERFKKTLDQSLPLMNSGQINQFIEATIGYEEKDRYLVITGIFVSALIQTAYNAGFNDFVLEPKGTQPLSHIGAYLKGTEKNPIKLTINAQTGGGCGAYAEHSIITNNAQTGKMCGGFARHSTFTNNAQIEDCYGWYAEHSTFKTNDQKILKRILVEVSGLLIGSHIKTPAPSGNKIIFINPDGTEE